MQSTATVVLLAATASANKIRVIGAGQGRTGTESLRVALNMLGFGPTYHMAELLGLADDLARPVGPGEMLGLVGGHNEKWVEIEKNVSLGKPCDFGFITEHYNSAVDFPAHAALPQLLAAYPEAKVVLTIRDAKSWHRSINGAFCKIIGGGSTLDRLVRVINSVRPYGMRNNRMHAAATRLMARVLGTSSVSWQKICDDEAEAVAMFEAWNAKVKKIVPGHRLLVFETGKHGWKELAGFLGVRVPDTPYPRTNSMAEFAFVVNLFRVFATLTIVMPCVLVWCLCRPRGKGKAKSGEV